MQSSDALRPLFLPAGKKFGMTHFINPKELGEKPVYQVITRVLAICISFFLVAVGVIFPQVPIF
jgi:Zn-dependent alcohol dehydrogenase